MSYCVTGLGQTYSSPQECIARGGVPVQAPFPWSLTPWSITCQFPQESPQATACKAFGWMWYPNAKMCVPPGSPGPASQHWSEVAKNVCQMSGGQWDSTSKSCKYPSQGTEVAQNNLVDPEYSPPGGMPANLPPCPEGTFGIHPFCVPVVQGGGGATSPIPSGASTQTPQIPSKTQPIVSNGTNGSWWDQRTDGEKVAIVAGSTAAVGLMVYLLAKKSSPAPTYVANPKKGKGPAIRVKAKTDSGTEKLFGHGVPPKKYRKLGFTKREHYAWPWGYNYPIGDAKHTRAAARYFGQHRHRYPKYVQKVIDSRIDRAKKHFAIGEYRGRVKPHRGNRAFSIRSAVRKQVKKKVTPIRRKKLKKAA